MPQRDASGRQSPASLESPQTINHAGPRCFPEHPASSLSGSHTTTPWSVGEESSLRGYTVEWAEPGDFVLSRGNRLYRADSLSASFEEIAAFPVPAWKAIAGRFRPTQRLLRFLYYNVLKLPGDELFPQHAHRHLYARPDHRLA